MGEAKRRKKLGVAPRKKRLDSEFPKLDKIAIQNQVRTTLYKYPIPFVFYGAALLIIVGGFIYIIMFYKLI